MPQQDVPNVRRRRGKRDKEAVPTKRPKRQSKALQKHKNDTPSGGIEVMLPSFIGLAILACGAMAKMGFRGRPSVAGIDLGTTNSVICVQAQSTGIEPIVIDCIADPASGSAVIPSVVSFLEPHEWSVGPSSKRTSALSPHPSHVVVGAAAKQRIDSHPHHTLYHAKRVIGRSLDDPSIRVLQSEVEFGMEPHNDDDRVDFTVPSLQVRVSPQHVGAYVVDHLSRIVANALGHENVKSAIICVPAKFNARQRQATVEAFRTAGMTVTRILEEPTAAALAYGLHRKEGVDYILVYDFGGGTLDLSLLHVSDGFVDVLGSDGDDVLGGSNFDDAIAQHLMEYHTASVQAVARVLQQYQWDEDALSNQCPVLAEHPLCSVSSFHTIGEQFKIQLSEQYGTSDDLKVTSQCMALPNNLADDTDVSTIESFCNALQPLDLHLTLATFERIVQPLLDRALAPISRLLDAYDMTAADINEIVMVGGTTRLPHIRQLVQTALDGSTMNTSIDPDLTVAYGAASVID